MAEELSTLGYAWGRLRRENTIEHVFAFLNPSDGILNITASGTKRPSVTYQIGVLDGAEGVLEDVLGKIAEVHIVPLMARLGRFGPASGCYLSFPRQGWLLSLELPAGMPTLRVLNAVDRCLSEEGGRVSLATDSRLMPTHIGRMYPKVQDFRAVARSLDPAGQFDSDLSRRLQLRPTFSEVDDPDRAECNRSSSGIADGG